MRINLSKDRGLELEGRDTEGCFIGLILTGIGLFILLVLAAFGYRA